MMHAKRSQIELSRMDNRTSKGRCEITRSLHHGLGNGNKTPLRQTKGAVIVIRI